jgi:exodeoxyribonuclease VII large subunit
MDQRALFGDDPLTPPAIFSVGEFLDFVNEVLGARDFLVQGEVVSARPHPTGMYFSLKDAEGGGVMDCYMSPYAYRGLGVVIEDGMQVKVGGAPSIYKPKGRFSFKVETLEPVGEGSLKKAYEALKKKLAEEGLFDRKRQLPEYVTSVGLITSKTGAVIDDFRRNLAKVGITVYHRDVRVEGAAAIGQVVAAIKGFDSGTHRIDVLVVIRGGGSMEDLQAFNSELVVRAVFGARVPTVISIGHDRDVPLAQMAADASASTPTAVAHLINDTWAPLTQRLPQLAQKLSYGYESLLASSSADVQALAGRLAVHLGRIAGAGNLLQARLMRGLDQIGARIRQHRDAVDAAQRHLESSDPQRLLRLGYSIVTDDAGAVIRSASDMRHGQIVRTRLAKGAFLSEVKELQSTYGEERNE